MIPRPTFDVEIPNAVHQADLLLLPHDKIGRKIYKYALTVVDIASRFKAAESLTSKYSSEVAKAFQKIYRGVLKWPKVLQVDPGREFMGEVTKEMSNHLTRIRRGNANVHRDQGIVERFNRTLSEKLFSYQYSREMVMAKEMTSERSREWEKRLPEVVSALNNEETRLTGQKPAYAIKEKAVAAKPSTTYSRPVGLKEKKLDYSVNLRYLLAPGELEGGQKRATDPIWSLKVFNIEPVLYYLKDGDASEAGSPKRGFVREEFVSRNGLLVTLKNPFQNHFFAFALNFVLRSIYFFMNGSSSKLIPL